MSKQTIVVDGRTFFIRGRWSPDDLRKQYASFQSKFSSKLTFRQWLVERGKVYCSVNS